MTTGTRNATRSDMSCVRSTASAERIAKAQLEALEEQP